MRNKKEKRKKDYMKMLMTNGFVTVIRVFLRQRPEAKQCFKILDGCVFY